MTTPLPADDTSQSAAALGRRSWAARKAMHTDAELSEQNRKASAGRSKIPARRRREIARIASAAAKAKRLADSAASSTEG